MILAPRLVGAQPRIERLPVLMRPRRELLDGDQRIVAPERRSNGRDDAGSPALLGDAAHRGEELAGQTLGPAGQGGPEPP